MDKLSEATEQIRQLENQTKILKLEIDDKNKEIRELEKKNNHHRPQKQNRILKENQLIVYLLLS